MYKELLDIVYHYSFNYKLPDKEFIISTINIILKYTKLNDYIIDITFNHDGIASYKYISKILSFDIKSISTISNKSFNKVIVDTLNTSNRLEYERFMYICFSIIKTIFHEFEHIRQNKIYNTSNKISFESKLISNNFEYLKLNYCVYQKEHDLFPIERLAILKSYLEVLDLISLDTEVPSYIKNNFFIYYNYFIELYYRNNTYPLLKYVEKTNSPVYYNNILIDRKNTKKILKKAKEKRGC